MSRHFGSLGEMGRHLATLAPAMILEAQSGLKAAAAHVEKAAKAEFGTYQPAAGSFAAWPELADATKDDRVRLGFTENDPLRRTGETAETITHEVHGLTAYIGSPDEKMVWFEFGTAKMPARPVLGPAAFNSREAIRKLMGTALVTGLIGHDQIHASLGYDATLAG